METMKYLSKIIFVNSAHIRFGTVELDGNVHFTGTQGVGKSTLLRAILFFYNADKMHLGIRQQGQRPFDDFYLPNPTSYIIYEVSRGAEHPFSVIVFKHRNRAVFRFVDAAFDSRWLIDEEGLTTSDPLVVRQRIQKQGIDISNIIERYEQYRDIIYGNSHAQLSKDLRKYSILESTQYQNIPRIIQNVFLNERVDADFIKDTIIRSMSGDEEMRMDLRFYRSQLADFSLEYTDIQQWTKKNRRGEQETLNRANTLIDVAHVIRAKELNLREDCGRLNYAMKETEKNIPLLHKEIGDMRIRVQAMKEKLDALRGEYGVGHDRLVGEIKVLDTKIRDSHRKQKEYQKQGIERILALAEQEPVFRSRKQQLECEIAELERHYQDIVQKYRALTERLRMDKLQFEQTQQQMVNTRVQAFNEHLSVLLKEQNKVRSEIEEDFRGQLSVMDEQIMRSKEALHQVDLQVRDVRNSEPFQKEIDDCQSGIDELNRQQQELEMENKENRYRMDTLRREAEIERMKVQENYREPIDGIQMELNKLDEQIASEEDLLERAKGSFCEWLDAHVEGWTDTIGKVVDEKRVLYHTALSPMLDVSANGTLYGVKLDLSEIGSEVRTPQEIEEHRDVLIRQKKESGSRLVAMNAEKEEKNRLSEQKYGNKLKTLREETRTAEQRLLMFPQQQKQARLQWEEWKEKQQAERRRQLEELDLRKGELRVAMEELLKKRGALEENKKRRIRQMEQKYRAEEKEARTILDAFKAETSEAIRVNSKEIDQRIAILEEQQNKDLKSEGADTIILADCKQKLQQITAKLTQIAGNQKMVILYQHDKNELFLREPEFIQEKYRLETERDILEKKYEQRKVKLEAQKAEQEKMLGQKSRSVADMEAGLEEAREFILCETYPAFIGEVHAIRTKDGCATIVDGIRQLVAELYQSEARLKETVNDFKKFFSERNTFRFPTLLNTNADYMEYAQSVDEFVSNDKIKDFQQLTSNVYIDILSRVSRDFGDLIVRESEIQKVVREVNYDFTQKTFAGVIRGIELKLERSKQSVITQLQGIHEFWLEHPFELGEANLFSSDIHDAVNKQAVDYLKQLTEELNKVSEKDELRLSDTFSLKFRIDENDNSTGWIDNIKMVGSDGTDILVKAIINILLISVFKQRVSRRSGDFRIHCMMDEIGKLADENIQGILHFANERNIFIVNSSPKSHRPLSYRRLYVLSKDGETNTVIQPILTSKQAVLR